MNCEILCVGTEILLGDIVNTNAHFLSRELAALGVNVLYQTAVGDNVPRLRQALDIALSRADLIITSGGLGPTEDDLTKETIAEACGLPLVMDDKALSAIEVFFRRRMGPGSVMPQNNRKQALLPEGSICLYNDHGTAPGCIIETVRDGEIKRIAILPGPPRELKPMFTDQVRPYLERSIRTFGVGESALEGYVTDFTKGTNPTAALYAKDGEALVRITAKAHSAAEANAMLDPVQAEIERRLGRFVYGIDIDNLEKAVVQLLVSSSLKIAVAESCTGGLIAQKLTGVPGASQVFECGVCAYANSIKTALLGVPESLLEAKGAVSEEVAAAMAQGVRELGNADIGVASTGIAGPSGGSSEKPVGLVYAAVAQKGKETVVRKLLLGHTVAGAAVSTSASQEREFIRELAALNALNMVRLAVLDR